MVPFTRHDTLVERQLIRPINYMSETESTMTRMIDLIPTQKRGEMQVGKTKRFACMMKLILNLNETNSLPNEWSIGLWDITQQFDKMDQLPGVNITFTKVFERMDDDRVLTNIKRRGLFSMLGANNEKALNSKNAQVAQDAKLKRALGLGDSVVSFGAEAIITAPTEEKLEQAVKILQDYIKANDVLRGLNYQIDINHQQRPFTIFGTNRNSGNHDLTYALPSDEAGLAALYVDSGGEKRIGAEYIGVSRGKFISAHAAYPLKHELSHYIGNRSQNKTYTMGRELNEPFQMYMSKCVSRAYALEGQNVVHLVLDNPRHVDDLFGFELHTSRKVVVDASQGKLNILEPIDDGFISQKPERVLSYFGSHLNNIIALLNMFRDTDKLSTTDDFANTTRTILTDFFVAKKYWQINARQNMSRIRLFSPNHDQMSILSDFAQYVQQEAHVQTDPQIRQACKELSTIITQNILQTIPALDTHTDPIIDELVKAPYRIVDFTGFRGGMMRSLDNPALNVMVLGYLNVLIPTLKNGDVIFIHGLEAIERIVPLVKQFIQNSGAKIDVVLTNASQSDAIKTRQLWKDRVGFTMMTLFENEFDELVDPLHMDPQWSEYHKDTKVMHFVNHKDSIDYVQLDDIL